MTFVPSAHNMNIKLPAIRSPNPKPTHPTLPGACTVAKISAVSTAWDVIGIENATHTPDDESHACVEDRAFANKTPDQQLLFKGKAPGTSERMMVHRDNKGFMMKCSMKRQALHISLWLGILILRYAARFGLVIYKYINNFRDTRFSRGLTARL